MKMRWGTKFSLFFFYFAFAHSLFSQNLRKAERRIYDGEFDKAEESIKKYIKNNPLSCCGYYYNALLIFQKSNSGNLQDPSKVLYFYKAYSNLDSAKIYRNTTVSSKEIDDINFTEEKNELKDPSFFANAYDKTYQELKIKIDNQLLYSLSSLKDEDKLNYYIKLLSTNKFDFSGSLIGNFKYESEIVKIRDEVAFDNAKTLNTESSFADYQSKYPKSLLFKQAQELKILASYQSTIQMLTEKSLNEFINKYSENKYLASICKYKKDSLVFHKAQATLTKASIQQFISNNPTSVYQSWAEFLLDSIKSSELTQGANASEIENYLYSNPSSSYFSDLLCKLKDVKFNSIKGSTNIAVLSQFYNEYLGANESNLLVTYKNKKTNEVRDFTTSDANSLLEKEWVLIRTKQSSSSTCGNDYYYLRDTLYTKVSRLRKTVLKIATQNQPLDLLVFKTTSGKILKHQMAVNDPVQGNVYVQINVNISPLESILKAINAVQNTDQLCFFAFNDSYDALGYRSYFPGFLNSNYVTQLQNSISVKLASTEIATINSITKNTYVGNPSAFYYLDNLWNKSPDSQSNVDVHKINFTLTSGYSLTILFTKNYFFITTDDGQIDQSMITTQKWSNKLVDKKSVYDSAKQKVSRKRSGIYGNTLSRYENEEIGQNYSSAKPKSTINNDRDPKSKDYANVYWNGKYPLYCLTSDVEILPKYGEVYEVWCATNENPTPFKKEIKKGTYFSAYKFANYDECLKWCNQKKGVNMGSQDKSEVFNVFEEKAPEIYTVVEEMPEFPGGAMEMMKYIQKNIQYPQSAKEAGLSGKCFLKFVVSGAGNITEVTILKGVPGCGDCDREAIRVVKSMPTWKAGKQNGRAVSVYFNLPINFNM